MNKPALDKEFTDRVKWGVGCNRFADVPTIDFVLTAEEMEHVRALPRDLCKTELCDHPRSMRPFFLLITEQLGQIYLGTDDGKFDGLRLVKLPGVMARPSEYQAFFAAAKRAGLAPDGEGLRELLRGFLGEFNEYALKRIRDFNEGDPFDLIRECMNDWLAECERKAMTAGKKRGPE